MDLKKFVLEGNPVCRKEAVIVGDHFRITMLTTALIRFEYSEDGGFEDRATQMVCNRDFPVPEFRVSDGGEELHIYTKDLEIHYDRQKFSPSGLMIRVAGGKASERVCNQGDEQCLDTGFVAVHQKAKTSQINQQCAVCQHSAVCVRFRLSAKCQSHRLGRIAPAQYKGGMPDGIGTDQKETERGETGGQRRSQNAAEQFDADGAEPEGQRA